MKNAKKLIKNKKVIRVTLAVLLMALIIGGFFFWETRRDRVFMDDSLITADVVTVSPATAGVLTEMDAIEGKPIKKGDIIAIINGEAVRSRTDGLVIATNTAVGGTVSTQTNLVQIIDPSQMTVVGTIDENKGLNAIVSGQVASFTVDAYPGKTYWGYVDRIGQTAKQTQAAFSISSERPVQQFQVSVRFNATAYPELKNGMSAKITVYTKM